MQPLISVLLFVNTAETFTQKLRTLISRFFPVSSQVQPILSVPQCYQTKHDSSPQVEHKISWVLK